MQKPDVPIISKLSDKKTEEFIPSGIPQLDAIIGGGFYRGRVTEIAGEEGTGKTHIVSKLMAEISKDQKILFCDAEFSLNKDRVEALGADSANIDYIADSRLENVCEQITNNIGSYDVIILDSLASLIPMTVEEQEVGSSANIGLFARLIKQFVMKMRPRLGRSNTALIVINQMRKPIGMYAKVEFPGGKAWHHVVDVRIRVTSNSSDKVVSKGVRTGHYAHLEITKSKVAQPYLTTKYLVEY